MICRQLDLIFVHIPKTGGQSIQQFFMDHLGLDWHRDRDQLALGKNSDPRRGPEKLAHLSAVEFTRCEHVTPAEFAAFYKFSFVRNPWERLLSEYLYRNYFGHRSFRDFVMRKFPDPGPGDDYRHVMPQYEMLHDEDGKLLVDFVGRFENMAEDFARVCRHLDIGNSTLPHRNRSDKTSRNLRRRVRNFLYRNGEQPHFGIRDYYDRETIGLVGEIYREDIETFGYRFPD